MADNEKRSGAHRLFDLRLLISALFGVYGVILTIVGLFDDASEIAKAQGVRINLWLGLAMLVFAGLVFLWARLRPIKAPEKPNDG